MCHLRESVHYNPYNSIVGRRWKIRGKIYGNVGPGGIRIRQRFAGFWSDTLVHAEKEHAATKSFDVEMVTSSDRR